MATSPPYTPTSGLNVPKKRPPINTLISTSASKRRKPSSAGPSHLRQTSFPPEFSPTSSYNEGRFTRSPSVESSIAAGTPSLISGIEGSAWTSNNNISGGAASVTGRKKRGRKKRSVAIDAESVVSAGGGGAQRGGRRSGTQTAAGSLVNGQSGGMEERDYDEAEEDENELDAAAGVMEEEGGKMDEAQIRQEREHLAMLIAAFTPDQAERYDTFRRVRLRKESVRRLTNHTLSQSAPASIITSISGFTKVFVGEIIERACDVQMEWMAAGEGDREALLKGTGAGTDRRDDVVEGETTKETDGSGDGTVVDGAIEAKRDERNLKERMMEVDRGPLRPEHLREALRRYRLDREGGAAGYLGYSQQGVVDAAPRTGGRKLFR